MSDQHILLLDIKFICPRDEDNPEHWLPIMWYPLYKNMFEILEKLKAAHVILVFITDDPEYLMTTFKRHPSFKYLLDAYFKGIVCATGKPLDESTHLFQALRSRHPRRFLESDISSVTEHVAHHHLSTATLFPAEKKRMHCHLFTLDSFQNQPPVTFADPEQIAKKNADLEKLAAQLLAKKARASSESNGKKKITRSRSHTSPTIAFGPNGGGSPFTR